MAAPIFTISGRDYITNVDVKSIDIQDTAPAQGDQMTFTLVMDKGELTGGPGAPVGGEIVSLDIQGVKHFEGVMQTVDQQVFASRDNYQFICIASDYTYLLRSKLVVESHDAGGSATPAGTAGSIVSGLIRKYAPGFGTRNIRAGFPVPEDDFDHTALTSVIDKYAQAIGFSWYVDFDREVHFSEGAASLGPVSSIALDTDDRLGEVTITEDVTQLTNRIYIKDATSKSSEKRVDTFIADGNTSFFRLFSPPYGDDEFKVLIDGIEVTSELDTLTTQQGEIEGSRDLCFFCIINAGLRFPLNFLPEEGAIVQAEYFPEEGGGDSGLIVVVEDPDSIRMMRQRESVGSFISDGVHESLVSVPELRVTNLDPLGFLGGLMLDRGAWPEIRGSWESSDTALVGFRPGQSVTLSSSNRNLFSSREYWRRGIKEDILVHVQSVSKKFTPYNTASGVDMLVTEHVEFSSISARLA